MTALASPALRVVAPAALLALLALAPAARADVPAWTDGPVFAATCKTAAAAAGCPSCRCEAVTSTSSIGVTSDATDIRDAVVVELRGEAAGKPFRQVHVFLGDDKQAVDGGVLATFGNLPGPHHGEGYELVSTKQVMDMCPGACDWDAVGLVHLFEVRETSREGDGSEATVPETTVTSLIACMEHDKRPGCWYLGLGVSTQDVTKPAGGGKEKRGKKRSWARTWKIGGKSGAELVLGKVTGNAARDLIERSGLETGKKTLHLGEIPTWSDATSCTPVAE
ncbi:MAG: hypothetical protein KC635_10675 [Myxococcales bacterium]|nr:hypothetical protein [Myxococcales bacterium]